MSKFFKRKKVEFSEYGNEPVRLYVLYFTLAYFAIAILLGLILSQFLPNASGVGIGAGLAASLVAANIACSAFSKRHERMLSMSEYKRLFWSSFWFNTLIQGILAVLIIAGMLIVAKHISRGGLAVMIIMGGIMGFFGNMLFIYLGFKHALISTSRAIAIKREQSG